MPEHDIWRRIAAHPEDIGYPNALALDQVQLGRHGGYIDLVLFPDPVASPKKLVLVEAKNVKNSDSSDKVVGQLLKYYARALRIGAEGLEGLRRFAKQEAGGSRRDGAVRSMRKVFNAHSQLEAHKLLEQGTPLTPGDVALVVALDSYQDKQARRLGLIVLTLQKHHHLPIALFEVRKGEVRPCPCSEEDV